MPGIRRRRASDRSGDDCRCRAPAPTSSSSRSSRVIGAAETEVDHVGALARPRNRGPWRDSSVSHTVAAPRRVACQHARRPSRRAPGATPAIPMPLSALAAMMPATPVPCCSATNGLPGDEIAVDEHLARKVRMVGLDAAVDDCDGRAAAGRDPVEVGEVPLRGRRLGGVERVVVRRRRALRADKAAPARAQATSESCDTCSAAAVGRAAVGHDHDEAVDADHRHRPIVDERQPVLAGRSAARDAPGRCARDRRRSRRHSRRSAR